MSIPNPFRPLCGSGETWLPYVQPVMTSRNTWSNEPSFGLEWGGVEGYAGYNDWKCMADTTRGWWVDGGDIHTSLLTFDRQLRIASVAFSDSADRPDGFARRIAFEAKVNGDWVMLGEWVRPAGMPYTEEITLDLRKVVAREYRVTNAPNDSSYSILSRLRLNAFFRYEDIREINYRGQA